MKCDELSTPYHIKNAQILTSLCGAIGQRVRLLTERLVVQAHPGTFRFALVNRKIIPIVIIMLFYLRIFLKEIRAPFRTFNAILHSFPFSVTSDFLYGRRFDNFRCEWKMEESRSWKKSSA